MEEEVWITLRFKGYRSNARNCGDTAKDLAVYLGNHLESAGPGSFTLTQGVEVIEVEDEATIYQE